MPYGSVRDLPTYIENDRLLQSMRWYRWLLPKEVRDELSDLQRGLERMAETIDSFYELLGPRNWVFHDSMTVDAMSDIVESHHADAEVAEGALIDWYQEPGRLTTLMMHLNRHEGLRARRTLLRLAVEDFESQRYYAVVHVLISVMDGFVNDLTPARPKGLHARAPEEMDAWDSVVGHHQGLTSAHKTFTRSFKARSDAPVHDLFRNGIVHGMVTNYSNVVVATKAWNRLFAVADWASAQDAEQRKAAKPLDPTLGELLRQMGSWARARSALEEFTATQLSAGDEEFVVHPVYTSSMAFLDAWRRRNYGGMAAEIYQSFGEVRPVEVRHDYQAHELHDFQLIALNHSAPAVCTAAVQLTVDGETHRPELRWIRETPEGGPAAPNQEGTWHLVQWGVVFMLRSNGE